MKVSVRLDLIDKIGRELQSRYRYTEIDTFLNAFGVAHPTGSQASNSKWLYTKEALAGVTNKLIKEIAQELEIDVPAMDAAKIDSSDVWGDNHTFRLFISHLATHSDKAKKTKEALEPYHIQAFVAHDDINPTREWQMEIEKALYTMDAMLCIHTEGFSNSVWTQQEIGFALGRSVKIISLRMNEDPKGFISKHQAILRRGRNAVGIAEEINTILLNDRLTKDRMSEVRANHQKLEDDEIPF